MHKVVHKETLKGALARKGWTQRQLADSIGVSAQSVTNWLKGEDFPRPDKLLRLATTLKLRFDELVQLPAENRPVVAFRRRAATKTTEKHVAKAMAMGELLRPLTAYLPPVNALRTELPQPSIEYDALQRAVAQVRQRLGIGPSAMFDYATLIGEFKANDAVIVPVLWGAKQRHENALHILLPAERVTFIYLNLDTHIEDFKFWMAHELAHVYTPALAGKEEGEDFADAFAGALLFPQPLAEAAYRAASNLRRKADAIAALRAFSAEHAISLYTVWHEATRFAKANGLAPIHLDEKADIHAVRNNQRGKLVSEILFDPLPPAPEAYIAAAQHAFGSEFFASLQRLLRAQGTGAGYVQQVLDMPLADATALHAALK